MSKLIVEVCRIDEIRPHPNADKLEIAIVKGWQCVVKKDQFHPKDIIVYIPINSLVPQELSDKFGFTQYLSSGRVKAARLRSEPSYGVLIPNETGKPEGTDVAQSLGITEWTPPVREWGKGGAGFSEEETPHPLFQKYTEIENMRHFPDVFQPGEEVVVTEKIHGTNTRAAKIDGTFMAGSHEKRRKLPMKPFPVSWLEKVINWILRRPDPLVIDWERMDKSWFTFPLSLESVRIMLRTQGLAHKQVILYGEVFGSKVQKGVRYGSPDKLDYRAFDVVVDGKYADYDTFVAICQTAGIPTVPVLYRGPFNLDKIKELSNGRTTIGNDTHVREGVVVKPVKERHDPKIGRVILKYVGDDYLTAKDIGDYEDE